MSYIIGWFIQDEQAVHMSDVIDTIEREGDSIAVILLPGVQYYTGQIFDMEAITKAGHQKVKKNVKLSLKMSVSLYFVVLLHFNHSSSRFHKTLRNCVSPLVQCLWSNLRCKHCASGLTQLRTISWNLLLAQIPSQLHNAHTDTNVQTGCLRVVKF